MKTWAEHARERAIRRERREFRKCLWELFRAICKLDVKRIDAVRERMEKLIEQVEVRKTAEAERAAAR